MQELTGSRGRYSFVSYADDSLHSGSSVSRRSWSQGVARVLSLQLPHCFTSASAMLVAYSSGTKSIIVLRLTTTLD
jgi:hypothetical protein